MSSSDESKKKPQQPAAPPNLAKPPQPAGPPKPASAAPPPVEPPVEPKALKSAEPDLPMAKPLPAKPAAAKPPPKPAAPRPAGPKPAPPRAAVHPQVTGPIIDTDADRAAEDDGDMPPKRSSGKRKILMAAAGLALVGVIILGGMLAMEMGPGYTMRPIGNQTVDEETELRIVVAFDGPAPQPKVALFSLTGAPEGATIEPDSGIFSWTPTEQQGPGQYDLAIVLSDVENNKPLITQPFQVEVREVAQPLVVEAIAPQTGAVGTELAVQVTASDPDVPPSAVRFALAPGAPEGAKIDQKGRVTWMPLPSDAGKTVKITAMAAKDGAEHVQQTFEVRVEGGQPAAPDVVASNDPERPVGPDTPASPDPVDPVEYLIEQLKESGLDVQASDNTMRHPNFGGDVSFWAADGNRIAVFRLGSGSDARRALANLSDDDAKRLIDPANPQSAYVFCSGPLIVFCQGNSQQLLRAVDRRMGRPAIGIRVGSGRPSQPGGAVATRDPVANVPMPEAKDDAGDAAILEMNRNGKLLAKSEYPKIRKIYADRFARAHAKEIQQVFGDANSEMQQWLAAHPDIKEEFYLAIDPRHDDVAKCLAIFKELKEKFPAKFESHASLAIATAVVWDEPQRAIQSTPTGQHGSLPVEGGMGALENFRYFTEAEKFMGGRARFLPWEFLTHVVNNTTTLPERQWAMANYGARRAQFGKCYHDVPYDDGMLEGKPSKISGKPHTLQNARVFGGVCSCQADYAARVGKSIGIPAFYATAESRFGGRHAWITWVELGSVTKSGLKFSLESYGRYRGDKYYIGELRDPHTGQKTTDRQVELRLQTVGLDPIAKRHADLVMRSYPMLKEKESLDITKELLLLNRIIEYSPGNEAAWRTLAKMSRDGQITKVNSRPMQLALTRLFKTFAKAPDFTWEVFDDMIAFEQDPKKRATLFSQLAAMYEAADRADLSCAARLKYADQLVSQNRLPEAMQVLALGVMRFPDDARFAPQMLNRMEELAATNPSAQQSILQLYQQLLPRISKMRGNRPSEYCIEMYGRGAARFRQAGLLPLAQRYEMELAQLKQMQP